LFVRSSSSATGATSSRAKSRTVLWIRRCSSLRSKSTAPAYDAAVPGRSQRRPPAVRLGRTVAKGISPSLRGLVEHGVARRPEVARAMRGRVVLRFAEDFSPVRITFGERRITVADGDLRKPDLTIAGSLPDIVHFATAPHLRGVPNPARAQG